MNAHIALTHKHVVGIVSLNSIDFITQVFNCFKKDQVVAFLSDRTDAYKIQVTGATEILTPKEKFGWCHLKFTPNLTRSVAQIAFTSGTTGQPKGVLLTHQALNDVVDRLNEIMEVDSSIREYVGVPTNYSFGFGRCRAVATVGGQFYIPQNGFNPLEIRDMLLEGSINAISAVPSLWRALFQCQELFGNETAAVKWIEIGSQYMSRSEKERLRYLFPQAKIVQHYGLTEASRSTFLRIDKTQGEHLESVGKAYGKTEIEISADGKIAIKGPHVAEKLLVAGQMQANVDANGWLTTNDLGMIKDGYLYYLGRADDLINCGGIKVSPDDIEKAIRQTLNIQSGIAVSRANDPLRGEVILVSTLTSTELAPQRVKDAAVQAAATHNIHSADAIKLMEIDEFPTTATGKVKRKDLTQLYATQLESRQQTNPAPVSETSHSPSDDRSVTDCEREIMAIWKKVLDVEHIDVDSDFFQIGGDSLTAISVMVRMEKLGISPPIIKGMLQGLSVRELAKRIERSDERQERSHQLTSHYTQTGMNINIVRGLLVLCVVVGHWSAGFLGMLPAALSGIKPYIAPFLAAGTPGFAIIYGVSAGYSMFHIFQTDRNRLKKLLYSTGGILAGGIVVLAFVRSALHLIENEVTSSTDIANTFYSVLSYYFIINATLMLWFKAIARAKNPIAQSVFFSVMLYCFYYYAVTRISPYEFQGFVQLLKLVVSAKYSYFNLAAGTIAGISIGILMRQNPNKQGIPNSFFWVGAALVSAGIAICSHAGMSDSWWVWPTKNTYIWSWLFYVGWILVSLKLTHQILLGYNQFSSWKKFVLQSLSTVGVLAFPIFVTHELVLPLKELMVAVGLPNIVSIAIALSLFFVTFVWLFKKIHSTNFIW